MFSPLKRANNLPKIVTSLFFCILYFSPKNNTTLAACGRLVYKKPSDSRAIVMFKKKSISSALYETIRAYTVTLNLFSSISGRVSGAFMPLSSLNYLFVFGPRFVFILGANTPIYLLRDTCDFSPLHRSRRRNQSLKTARRCDSDSLCVQQTVQKNIFNYVRTEKGKKKANVVSLLIICYSNFTQTFVP